MIDEKPVFVHNGLSVSSLKTFQTCQLKYWHYKINKTPVDPDVEEKDYFKIGSAFHKVVEHYSHDRLGDLDGKVVAGVCRDYGLTRMQGLGICAMVKKYHTLHVKSGLTTIAVELMIDVPDFAGKVDAVMHDDTGWWIIDLKTCGKDPTSIHQSLNADQQLMLYSVHGQDAFEALGLSMADFMGVRYRATLKPKLVLRGGEEDQEYIARLLPTISSYDFIVPVGMMRPNNAVWAHAQASKKIRAYDPKDGSAPFAPNLEGCRAYFSHCEYWSQCHGRTYSESTVETLSSEG